MGAKLMHSQKKGCCSTDMYGVHMAGISSIVFPQSPGNRQFSAAIDFCLMFICNATLSLVTTTP